MMKQISPVLRSGLVAAVVALLPPTEAAATWDFNGGVSLVPPIAAGSPPVRSCPTFTLYPGKTVQIIAGPANALAGDIAQATNFPVKVSSVTGSGASYDVNCTSSSGQCLKWEYKWIFTGVTPSYSFVTLDSDLALWEAKGGPLLTRPWISNPLVTSTSDVGERIAEVRVLRFNAYGNSTPGPGTATFNGALYTGLEARVGKVTAGFQTADKKGFCAIQGAENAPGGDFLQSTSKTFTTNTLGCVIDWTLSPDSCATDAVLNPAAGPQPQCTISKINDVGGIIGQTCQAEISKPGSTTTCRWNSLARTNICVTVP